MKAFLIGGVAMIAAAATPALAAVNVSVPGYSNPFLAGQPPATTCCFGDNATDNPAIFVPVTFAGGEVFTFSATGGSAVGPTVPANATPDGSGAYTMIDDYGTGIAGGAGVRTSALVGVFLGDGVPTGPAPAQFDSNGGAFASLSPGLFQIFFIGDGLTGTGTGSVQQFVAPTGATRLFLGTVDGFGWFNNGGGMDVAVTGGQLIGSGGAVPEPSAWALMILGFGAAGAMLRRKATLTA